MRQTADNNYLLGDITHDIYLAHPEGFTESGRMMIQNIVLPQLVAGGVSVYEPFREFYPRAMEEFGEFNLNRREICLYGARINAEAIKKSKLVLAILDGVDVDSGTASEIGSGSSLGKRIIGIRTDLRGNSADGMGVRVNLQVEGFIDMSGGMIYPVYDQAIKAAVDYIFQLRANN